MDFLLDNPLTTMDAIPFLVLFIVFNVVTLFTLGIVKSNLDKTDRLQAPAIPPEIDPYEVAYLRGGVNEMARSVVFSLMQKGLVEIVNVANKGTIRSLKQTTETRLSQVERTALNWIGAEREAKDVFDAKSGLTTQLETYGAVYHDSLESRQLLTASDLRQKAFTYGLAAALLIAAVGGYRIITAVILFGNFNIIFAIFVTFVGFIIAMTIGRMPRVSKLGKLYIERLQLAFETLKYKSQAPYIGTVAPRPVLASEAGFAGVDPLLVSVGVFGTAILAGTMYANYNDAFAKAQQQQAASSGGCGGSSCGSSDGGSSSCGSGCGGGCGGGGCGG